MLGIWNCLSIFEPVGTYPFIMSVSEIRQVDNDDDYNLLLIQISCDGKVFAESPGICCVTF